MIRTPDLASERGAILVQTVLGLLLVFSIAAFVVDYGVVWVGRHQAQNAADAGAIAGAIARAYDDFDDPPDAGGAAFASASQAASANLVWAAVPAVPPPTPACPPEFVAGRCVRVDVHRDGAHSNALPTVFGSVWSLVLPPISQDVRATATARVLVSNATNCLRPWAIPDKWGGTTSYLDGTPYAPPADVYTAPGPGGPGTGLQFPTSNAGVAASDLDDSIGPLTFDDLTLPANPILRSSVVPLALDTGYFGSRDACNQQIVSIGDQIPISAAPPVAAPGELDTLPPGLVSPGLVAVAVFDVEAFRIARSSGWMIGCPGTPCVTVVNIIGLVIGAGGTDGVIAGYPGLLPTSPTEVPALSPASSFLKAISLVR